MVAAACETCRYWKQYASMSMWGPELRTPEGGVVLDENDLPVDAPGSWGECSRAGEFGPSDTSDRFFVVDGSEYRASLQTRDDFGCVEHEWTTP